MLSTAREKGEITRRRTSLERYIYINKNRSTHRLPWILDTRDRSEKIISFIYQLSKVLHLPYSFVFKVYNNIHEIRPLCGIENTRRLKQKQRSFLSCWKREKERNGKRKERKVSQAAENRREARRDRPGRRMAVGAEAGVAVVSRRFSPAWNNPSRWTSICARTAVFCDPRCCRC